MMHYKDHIAKRTDEIVQLQREWEVVVGEIWKLGVSCLGEDPMEKLLCTNTANGSGLPSSSPSKAESTLFVPEQGTSPVPPPRKTQPSNKKHVTFETPNVRDKYNAASLSRFPHFLCQQPSRHGTLPFPIVCPVAEQDMKTIELQVKQLGIAEIDELRKIDQEYQAYWRKKTAQLVGALKDD